MAISKNDVLEYISGLSVLELSELVKEFEEKFGVSAAPVVVAGAAGGAAAGAAAEEKTAPKKYPVLLGNVSKDKRPSIQYYFAK